MADDDRKNTRDSYLNFSPSTKHEDTRKYTWKFTKSELEILFKALVDMNASNNAIESLDLAMARDLTNRIAAGIENC